MNRRYLVVAVVCVATLFITMAVGCGGGNQPEVLSVTPDSGAPGIEVTITGTYFGQEKGSGNVEFGTVTADIEEWSETEIKTRVPEGLEAGEYPVKVTSEEGSSGGVQFKVIENGKESDKTGRKEGQVEHNTPADAMVDYMKSKGIDTNGVTFSVYKVSETDPDWKIDRASRQGDPDEYFLLHRVKGEWTVVDYGRDFDPQADGAPDDLTLEPPSPEPVSQDQAVYDYLKEKGEPTEGWTLSVYKVSDIDSNWEVIEGRYGDQSEKFLLVYNNMLGGWEVLAAGEPPWTGVEFKGESVPSDLNE